MPMFDRSHRSAVSPRWFSLLPGLGVFVFLAVVHAAGGSFAVAQSTGGAGVRDPGAAESSTVRSMGGPGLEEAGGARTGVSTDDAAAAWFFSDDGEAEQWLVSVFGEGAAWLTETVGQNALWRYFAAFFTVVVLLLLRRWALGFALRVLKEAAQKTSTDLDSQLLEALSLPVTWIVGAFALYAGTVWLVLSEGARHFATGLLRIVVVILVAQGLYRSIAVVGVAIDRFATRRGMDESAGLRQLVLRFLRVLVWLVAALVVIQELGYNVTGLVAGLGVGGLAVALAAKDTLANWFGALMIFTDRPFSVGDWIKTSNLEGTVEEIGLRSTKVRTFARTLVSVPNSTVANAVVENFSRMPVRRVSYTLGVTYGTTPAMMQESLERIRDILRTHEAVDQTFWIVRFTDFGSSSLDILVMYFTKTTVWDEYLAAREEINLLIMTSLSAIGVSVAFPTRSVYVENTDAEEVARLDRQARKLFEARAGSAAHGPEEPAMRGNEDA